MATAIDRQLLFGLLALQNGLIDQDQLVSAFRAEVFDRRFGVSAEQIEQEKAKVAQAKPMRPRRPTRTAPVPIPKESSCCIQ